MKWNITEEIEELSWQQAREKIFLADPDLSEIIDDINPSDKYRLVRVCYPYGAIIYSQGTFFVPVKSDSILPIQDADVPQFLKSSLSYSVPPLGISTKGVFEVFKETGNHIFPLSLRRLGIELGIWEAFSPSSPYTVSSGSRSAFMLPKLTDSLAHKRLKQFGIRSTMPSSVYDQWYIFRELANYPSFAKPWYSEFYFFDRKWIKHIKEDKEWSRLLNKIFERKLKHSDHRISDFTIWENFFIELEKRRIKFNQKTIEILKHIMEIASGFLPGFKSITPGSIEGPFDEIIRVYEDVYNLKNYYPSIFYADYFNIDKTDAVYYSLQVPSTSFPQKAYASNTIRKDLIDLIECFDYFVADLSKGHLGLSSTYQIDLFRKVQLDFFHTEPDVKDYNIYCTKELPEEDPKLLYLPRGIKHQNKVFCDHSSFTRGCVRISKKT